MPADTPAPTATPQREQSIRVPVLRGRASGAIQAVSPRNRGIAGRAGSQLMRACPVAEQDLTMAVVPDYSLGDVDAGTAPEPDVVVIPAVVSPAGRRERPLREWLTRRAGRGAHLLGVCAGSRLLAAAGLLDGHRATSHWSRLRGLQRSRPQVDWVAGQRYVQDGNITTTAGVTSGVFGALRLVQQLAGLAAAQRA